ncbi:hypothetical protein [Streptomyces sp. NBC_01180]|uniref:hypothetical protein n=1 Tax=Streptomyces sp. NBC_01180 TaxID=2903763 RepID=UPI00386F0640|nr:hypothetical protein OG708_00390 [Streptomyces sp. NBC_01180]
MTAQPDHHDHRAASRPAMGTLAELRTALATWGFPGDLAEFERELDATDLDDLSRVREVVQAYRHRVLLRFDIEGAAALTRSTADVTAELRRKMASAER